MAKQRFYREVRHAGLSKYRVVIGETPWIGDQKAKTILDAWNQEWGRRVQKEQRQAIKLVAAQTKEEKKQYAAKRSNEIEAELDALRGTLRNGLKQRRLVDWNAMKTEAEYSVAPPTEPDTPTISREPRREDLYYKARLSWIDHILVFPKGRKLEAARARLARDHEKWRAESDEIVANYRSAKQSHAEALKAWQDSRDDFCFHEQGRVEAVQSLYNDYHQKKTTAIEEYCQLVLSASDYPDYFPRSFEIEYRSETRILVVDYALPAPDNFPKVKEVRYVQSRDELQEVALSESEMARLFDDVLYQIVLRSVFELYQSDEIEAIDLIALNGYVRSIDQTTGNEVNPCVMSLQVNRAEFLTVNLANVDPKACFKKLKGIGSSKLIGLAPVAPTIKISREDARFISAHDVVDSLDTGSNLAAMDWEEFEYFIRELFSKEFDKGGGEVKITRASRDGGVDAVAFDPDPIRGGKIVIQAKRYTNTVNVSAVRDLYGTVMNEGAIKGILVTTADYGPDSYEFAKDKPLTLINGNELLFLVEKHGHSYRINLKEAKEMLAAEQLPKLRR